MILLIPFVLVAAILSACHLLSNDWYWSKDLKMRKRNVFFSGIGLLAQHIASAGMSEQDVRVFHMKKEFEKQLENSQPLIVDVMKTEDGLQDVSPTFDNRKNNRHCVNIKHYHDNQAKVRKFRK